MKIGNRATIFNTGESGIRIEEGVATITKIIMGNTKNEPQLCNVKFDNEAEEYLRWVSPEDIINDR